MEAIRQYIESLFMNLPNTTEVLKAKQHLLEMAEDKYTCLKDEGVSDNEAVATVIAEFGNLDELKEELGIEDAVKWQQDNRQGVNMISAEAAEEILHDFSKSAIFRGFGVMCFIACTVPVILTGEPVGMFIMIALGIAACVVSNSLNSKWDNLKSGPWGIDLNTAEYIKAERRRDRTRTAGFRAIAVLMLVGCWIPATKITDKWGGALLFILIGVGVWILIYLNSKERIFNKLLSVNPMGTYGATFSKGSGRVFYKNANLAAVMSIFWPLVSCLYISLSFVTFAWWITWIVFPIGAAVHKYIEEGYGERE